MIEPFRHIIVPLDGSRLAEAALPSAVAIATRMNARVTLLHVIEHKAPTSVHGERHLNKILDAAAYLSEIARRYQDTGAAIDTHVHPNEEHYVAQSIAEHADELGVDLVALATHGSGGIRGLIFGSVAQQVLRRTTTPVLLVRPESDPHTPFANRAILVPLDGGADAEAALPYAEMLANELPSALRLVRVVPTVGTVRGPAGASATFSPVATAGLLDIEAGQARDYLTTVMARLPGHLDVTGEVRRGSVPDALIEAAAMTNADLTVVATHAKAGIESFLAGSVGATLLDRLARPLLLIRIHDSSGAGDE